MGTFRDHILPVGASLLVLTAGAAGQAINLDVGDGASAGIPSSAYGAAAGQPGVWNNVSSGSGAYVASGLLTVAGAVSGASVASVTTGSGLGDFSFDNPLTSGDDGALMDDLQDVGTAPSETTWTWSGLADGPYAVYVYAWAPDSPTFITQVEDLTGGSTILVGPTDWPGTHVEGLTYARFCVDVVGGTFSARISPFGGGSFASVNGWQLVPGGACEPGLAYCDADGAGATPCPCANDNDGSAGGPAGCANTNNAAGASLGATGSASFAAADLVLAAANVQPSQPGLFFQADNAVNAGAGSPFGDGLRCAGGNVRRLEVVFADPSGLSATTVDVGAAGLVGVGDVKRYQLWYRNPAISACAAGFNLTNGYEITWAP